MQAAMSNVELFAQLIAGLFLVVVSAQGLARIVTFRFSAKTFILWLLVIVSMTCGMLLLVYCYKYGASAHATY